jgi:hypothetical protein
VVNKALLTISTKYKELCDNVGKKSGQLADGTLLKLIQLTKAELGLPSCPN